MKDKQEESSVILQSLARMFIERKRFIAMIRKMKEEEAGLIIQKFYRMH
jgi:hypothetical protein